MKTILRSNGYALGVCALFLSLGGCNGANAPSTSGPSFSPSRAATNAAGFEPDERPNRRVSWMSSAAKLTRPLLYASNWESNDVVVYAYRTGKVVGELTKDIDGPYGECSDSKGDVWITNYDTEIVVEYAHAAKTPRKELSDTGGASIGCSVDATTGNLAVANFAGGTPSGAGYVVIYANASGTGTNYTTGDTYLWPPAYDGSGNLFVEGENVDTGAKELLELPKGGTTFTIISLPFTLNFPAAAYWNGKYVGVSDQEYGGDFATGIYWVSVSGSAATLKGTVVLTGNCTSSEIDVVQGAINAGKLVGGNLECSGGQSEIGFWSLSDGNLIRAIVDASASGVAISR